MSWVTKGIRAVAVAAIAVLVAPAALAQQSAPCPDGTLAVIGSGSFASTVEWNRDDPLADFAYYFPQDPTVNEGTLDIVRNSENLGAAAGTSDRLQEGFLTGLNIGANDAFGTNGCPIPLTDKRAVFIFTDSQGSVVISIDGGASLNWDFDVAARSSPTVSLALDALGLAGTVLTKSRELNPTIVSLSQTNSIVVKISWAAPRVWTDAPTNPLTGTYSVAYVVVPRGSGVDAGTPVEVADSDGSLTDTQATVTLPDPVAGQDTLLIVRCNIAGSGGRSITGGPSVPIRVDPTLASPGKGKKLGHDKAPGQNR